MTPTGAFIPYIFLCQSQYSIDFSDSERSTHGRNSTVQQILNISGNLNI